MLEEPPALVSVMAVNNEVRTPRADRTSCRARSQARAGNADPLRQDPGRSWMGLAGPIAACDLISISAHKFGGPKGVLARSRQATSARRAEATRRWWRPGRERRAGTQNVAGAVAMAAAARATTHTTRGDGLDPRALRAARWQVGRVSRRSQGFVAASAHVRGSARSAFLGVETEELFAPARRRRRGLGRLVLCQRHSEESHVLAAMGVGQGLRASVLRFSFGESSTIDELEWALEVIHSAVERLSSS